MRGYVKALFGIMFVFLILFVAGCGDEEDDADGTDSNDRQTIQDTTINGIECVLVKAGTFKMGSPTSDAKRDSDETQHKVTLTEDFWISKYPITKAQYYEKTYEGYDANYPITYVNWTQANEFAQSLDGRLPTEAQWEFAARGGINSKGYIYSGSNNLDNVAIYNSLALTVGQKQANELGIYDMSGNVWEWCSDWYAAYPTGAVTNPTGPSTGGNRV